MRDDHVATPPRPRDPAERDPALAIPGKKSTNVINVCDPADPSDPTQEPQDKLLRDLDPVRHAGDPASTSYLRENDPLSRRGG